MFSNLFSKKVEENKDHLFTDRVYFTTSAKMNAIAEMARGDESFIFIAWFEETYRQCQVFFTEKGLRENRFLTASQFQPKDLLAHSPIFVEHYPLRSVEKALVMEWNLNAIPVYSALDEPLFKHFGSDKIIPILKMMGMKPQGIIEHAMVSSSIINGQEKIAEHVIGEEAATSQGGWMQLNFKQ